MVGFLFGGSTGETPETLKRKRAIAESLVARSAAPKNVGEGLSSIGNALIYRALMSRADKAEKTGTESAASDFAPLLGGFGSPTPGATGSAMPKVDASGNVALPSTGKEWETIGPRLTSDLSKDFQLSPEQAAGIVGQLGQESAGFGSLQEKNPVVPGSRGGFGYAQWTGPRRKQFEAYAQENGLDPTSYEANYGFLKNELANTPEGAVLGDLRNAPDAMTAGRVFTDKFLRPGIPNYDSRDAWTKRALAFAAAPTEVASLDPGAGLPETASDAISAVAPLPMQPQPAPQQPSQAVAQALMAPQKGGRLGQPQQPLSEADFNSRFGNDATGAIPPQADAPPLPLGNAVTEPQTAPQNALPPLPVSTIAPAPNVASAPPMADTGQQPNQPNQQVAQALLRQDQSGVGIGGGVPASDSGYFPAAPSAPGQSGPSQAQILRVLTNPYASDSQKAVAQALLQRSMSENDPDTLLERQYKQAQIAALTGKPQKAWQKLSDTTLFNPETAEVKDISAPGPDGKKPFRFGGNSVEAQSLNGLIDSGAITPDQAQQLGAGKTITGPNGEIIFMTPQGVFGQPSNGGQPQPMGAPVAPQQPYVDLFGDGGAGAPAAAPVAPSASTPATAPVPTPAAGTPALPAPEQRPGMIPLTEGKPGKPLTEGERKNQSLYSVIKPELKVVEDNFDALTDPNNQVFSKMPFSEFVTTPQYQQAANSLQTIVSSYLYSVSGATATPEEVRKQTDILTPRPGESKESIANKKRRVRTMVDAVARTGGLTPEDAPAIEPVAPVAAPSAPRAKNPTTGEILELRNGQWVPVK
jgi:hypothetical protein